MNLESENLPENAFDFVTALDVLEHITNPIAAVRDLIRATKLGGVLIVQAHFADNMLDCPMHVYHDERRFYAALRSLGLARYESPLMSYRKVKRSFLANVLVRIHDTLASYTSGSYGDLIKRLPMSRRLAKLVRL